MTKSICLFCLSYPKEDFSWWNYFQITSNLYKSIRIWPVSKHSISCKKRIGRLVANKKSILGNRLLWERVYLLSKMVNIKMVLTYDVTANGRMRNNRPWNECLERTKITLPQIKFLKENKGMVFWFSESRERVLYLLCLLFTYFIWGIFSAGKID